ncbi:hypothetical protein CPC08DRAFT_704606 [Agrocybe pediades]|nr:hypothetical protein CPC08DRAFT_704606 [Agrocybe pediades]
MHICWVRKRGVHLYYLAGNTKACRASVLVSHERLPSSSIHFEQPAALPYCPNKKIRSMAEFNSFPWCYRQSVAGYHERGRAYQDEPLFYYEAAEEEPRLKVDRFVFNVMVRLFQAQNEFLCGSYHMILGRTFKECRLFLCNDFSAPHVTTLSDTR